MSTIKLSDEDAAILHDLISRDDLSCEEMIAMLGLDPGSSFRDTDLSGMDFSGIDLRTFDFSGASFLPRPRSAERNHTASPSANRSAISNLLRQTTLLGEVELSGRGVHSGSVVSMMLHPAEADIGYRFIVTEKGRAIADFPAIIDNVTNLTRSVTVGDSHGASVASIEHVLSALRGSSVDNCYIEVDNREVPVLDGSAAPIVEAIEQVGFRELPASRRLLKVLRSVRVEEDGCWAEIAPHVGFHLDVEIDFSTPVIGRQRYACEVSPRVFRNDICWARDFGFMHDVERLWKAGLALGANLDNTIAIGDEKIINREGLRHPQEFLRHKMLDTIGVLALAGHQLLCSYRSVRAGLRLNALLLKALMADSNNWHLVTLTVGKSENNSQVLIAKTGQQV